MAQFSKVNGDLLPVLHLDAADYTNSGANAVADGMPVQPQGPKLDFFTVTGTGTLTGTQVNLIIQATQQLATVYMYEYTNDTNDTLAMAVYPTGAWTDVTLASECSNALTAGNVANTVSVTTVATFYN